MKAMLKDLIRHAIGSQESGRDDEAVRAWRAVLLADPDNAKALSNLALVLRRLGRVAESEAVLRTALERNPDSARLHMNYAVTQLEWGRQEEAIASAERAGAIAPDDSVVHHLHAELLLEIGRQSAARAALERAIAFDPDHAPSLMLLTRLMRLSGEADRALEMAHRAVAQVPKDADAHVQYALALLANGRLKEGFREYDWRWRTGALPPVHEGLPKAAKPWTGDALGTRRLLVRAEQGFSEVLQFVRLLGLIEGGHIILEAPGDLLPLLRASRLADEVIPEGGTVPEVDCWVPLLSLPRILKIDAQTVPDRVPYLRSDPSLLAPWRAKLGEGLKIAISWHGGEPAFDGVGRAVPLAAFEPLMALEGVRLISLQKGAGRDEADEVPFPVHDFDTELDEGDGAFLDSIAVIEACDLVVTAPTAIAHLAGALGKPVMVAVPEGGDWRFGWHPVDSAWYPTMELVRKPVGGEWRDVFAHMARRLTDLRNGES